MGILKPLNEIIKGSIFVIPDYQRSFTWEDKQIEDLIEDIEGSLKDTLNHYLGQIILEKNKQIQNYTLYKVIDGQQRLTSILLFLLSFCKDVSLKRHLVIDNDEVKNN
ncbi:MAG: DUF262 domain-containing protein [Thermodesulfobacteriota bacterium]